MNILAAPVTGIASHRKHVVYLGLLTTYVLLLCGGNVTQLSSGAEKIQKEREEVIKYYKSQFANIGNDKIAELTTKGNPSLALQASWESNKKLIERKIKEIPTADYTYDPDGVSKFLKFMTNHSSAPVPEWWSKALLDLSVAKGKFHLYAGTGMKREDLKEVFIGGTERYISKDASIKQVDNKFVYSAGKVTLHIQKPKKPGDILAGNCIASSSSDTITCIGAYNCAAAWCYKIAGFDNATDKQLWAADIWALGTSGLSGPSEEHRVELLLKKDTVFVFGVARGGLYLEAFELKTGKCQFRFCTSYWGSYSEAWRTK